MILLCLAYISIKSKNSWIATVMAFLVFKNEIVILSQIPFHNFFFRKGLHKRQVFLKENINPNFTI